MASKLGDLFSSSGHVVRYGVRTPEKNKVSIADAIDFAEVVLLAIPYEAVPEIVVKYSQQLSGKIVVDMINPVNLSDWSAQFLGEDSSGEQTARSLPNSRVVKAFNAIFADIMLPERNVFKEIKATAFIASEVQEAAQAIEQLARDAGFAPVLINGIHNSRYLEAMANLNISIALQGGGTNAGFIYFQH